MATKKEQEERVIIPWVGDADELAVHLKNAMVQYQENHQSTERENKRKGAGDRIRELIKRIVQTQGRDLGILDPALIDGIVVSPVGMNGKHWVFQRSIQKRKTLDQKKLLELGCPAPFIEMAMVETPVESWSLIEVKAE